MKDYPARFRDPDDDEPEQPEQPEKPAAEPPVNELESRLFKGR